MITMTVVRGKHWEQANLNHWRVSQPFIGQQGAVEIVVEYRVEMICSEHYINLVLKALIDAHPYETSAYDVQSIKTLNDF